MNQRYQSADIRRVAEQFAENELYRAICSIGNQLESELEFGLCPEECFMDTQELLSDIIEKGEDFLAETENLWLRKYNEYKRFDRHMGDEDVRKAVGVVFGFTILATNSSKNLFYYYTVSRQLMEVVAYHKFNGWTSILERIFSVPLIDGWFDATFKKEKLTSTSSSNKKAKTILPRKKPKKIENRKPKTLKYYTHANNGVLMKQHKRVDIVFNKLNEWGWIDNQTTAESFDSFFEGEPKHCNITWKANSTILTMLIQELLQQTYIERQAKQSPSSMVKEQFETTPNFDKSRLTDKDRFLIAAIVFLLDIRNPLPLRKNGDDNSYDITDAALQAILSGQLRTTKGI